MAEVFLATSFPPTPTRVGFPPPLFALKRLLPRYSSSRLFVQRLVAEAKLAALLHHPNLLAVLDLGTCGTDFFLKMEWVDGKSLDRFPLEGGRSVLSTPSSLRRHLIRELCLAIQVVHTARDSAGRPLDLVHRDITPQNILISYDGEVKLADFGIATAERGEKSSSKEAAIGKLPYMAPEQILRKPPDRRSDLYALGVVLFELLAGHKPFEGGHAVELQQRILNDPPDWDLLPKNHEPALVPLLKSLLAKNPSDRPPDIAALLKQGSLTDPVPGGEETLKRWMAETFRAERAAEEKRRMIGLEALKREPLPEEDLLSGVESAPSSEKTDIMEKGEPPAETRVIFKPVLKEEPSPLARVELVKRSASRIAEPAPLEKAEEAVEPPPPVEPEDVIPPVLYESSTPGMIMEEVSLREVEISAPASLPAPESVPPFATVAKRQSFRFSLPFPAPRSTFLVVGAILFLLAAWHLFPRWVPLSGRTSDLPVQVVDAYVSVEGMESSSAPLSSWASPTDRLLMWQYPVSKFFASEYRRHTGRDAPPFTLSVPKPVFGAPRIRWVGSIFNPDLPFEQLSSFFALPSSITRSDGARLFIHLYPKRYEDQPAYPLDLTEKRPYRQGIVYIPLSTKEEGESLVRLAHEVAHLLGATDKYDEKGLPNYPEGFIDPLKDPLYPQEFGDLMTRGIPESPERYKPFESLNRVRIGAATARELGWTPVTGR